MKYDKRLFKICIDDLLVHQFPFSFEISREKLTHESVELVIAWN
jgi:hypothetical protein